MIQNKCVKSVFSSVLSLVSFMVLLCGNVYAASARLDDVEKYEREQVSADEGWRLVKDKKGIKVYTKELKKLNMQAFRGQGVVQFQSRFQLEKTMNNIEGASEWLAFVNKIEEYAPAKENVRFARAMTVLPFVKSREGVIKAVYEKEGESTTVHLINQPDAIPKDDKYVRIPKLHGKMQFVPQDKDPLSVMVVYEVGLDPGGVIPAKLAELLLRSVPYYSISKLRKIVAKDYNTRNDVRDELVEKSL